MNAAANGWQDLDCATEGRIACEASFDCIPDCEGGRCGQDNDCGGLCTSCADPGQVCNATAATCAAVSCPPGYTAEFVSGVGASAGEAFCWREVSSAAFGDAAALCKADTPGGQLLTLKSAAKHAWLVTVLDGSSMYPIALTWDATSGASNDAAARRYENTQRFVSRPHPTATQHDQVG